MVFIRFCNPWESYMAYLEAECADQEAEYELSQDRDTEAELARLEAVGEGECPWPWYADAPTEVQMPQMFSLIHGEGE